MNFQLRPPRAHEAGAIAQVFSRSRRLLTFVPELHSVEEDRWFIENVILRECRVLTAVAGDQIAAFMALQDQEIRLLHADPEYVGRGAGSLLVDAAKSQCSGGLVLWCFQANTGARRFYERHGFQAAEFTDGERNEENLPDVLYRWDPTMAHIQSDGLTTS